MPDNTDLAPRRDRSPVRSVVEPLAKKEGVAGSAIEPAEPAVDGDLAMANAAATTAMTGVRSSRGGGRAERR